MSDTKEFVDTFLSENVFDAQGSNTIPTMTLKEQETQAILAINAGLQRYKTALSIAHDALNHTDDEMKRELAIQMIEELMAQ
jgi:hypothetical protein